jgi:hypothetical protein|tara:strand:+ start:22564 stop:22791 length:228 start_codon:yes stop_codon:yes gene_type:complete
VIIGTTVTINAFEQTLAMTSTRSKRFRSSRFAMRDRLETSTSSSGSLERVHRGSHRRSPRLGLDRITYPLDGAQT